MEWTPSSWRSRPTRQQATYTDIGAVDDAVNKLKCLPPLVTATEVEKLRGQLRNVALNRGFLLQGGDCAESFGDCSALPIEAKVKVLLQMSLVMTWGARIPVVRLARMAGQYAKPRSSPTEMYEGRDIPSFRGHNINGFESTNRTPDPSRLVQAYFHSAATLNYLRGLLSSGFADLHNPQEWSLDWIRSSKVKERYANIVDRILDCMSFMNIVGADSDESLKRADIYISHEGLLLGYEESMTREVKTKHYNLGAHFLWIGDRTRQLDGGHVEYFRGLQNPIGVKVGPTMSGKELVALLNTLDPNKEPGKVTLISRYGAAEVERLLPAYEHFLVNKSTC